ncbi:Regulatory protein AfsR [Actinokineospora sp. UTMC 2448]|nr:Regulatory protein AfsR [Actinokineospora sp. UTMC 2448]
MTNGRQKTPDEETFGAALHAWRVRRGLSLAELQHATSFSRSHLGNVEHGLRQPTHQLATACDTALQTDGALARLLQATPRTTRRRAQRPAQLPARTRHFTGRAECLDRMRIELEAARRAGETAIITIDGPAGIGKTSLAVQWAHEIASEFPDGVLFADLRGYDPSGPPADAGEVLRDYLVALGHTPAAIPRDTAARIGQYRTTLAGRRLLIVLDNAAGPEQVRPLLPSAPSCAVIITSRTALPGLAARDGARRVVLGPLRENECVSLLSDVAGSRARENHQATLQVARQCGGHPLALRIAAERANDRNTTMTALSEVLAERPLDVLSTSGDDVATLRTTFALSYRALSPAAARLFRRLGLHPGAELAPGVAAALDGTSVSETEQVLDQLVSAHLLEEVDTGRYRIHDLLKVYAAERAHGDEPDQGQVVNRMLGWYLSAAQAASRMLSPNRPYVDLGIPAVDGIPVFASYDDAADWCEVERLNLALAASAAAEAGNVDVAVKLPIVLCDFLFRRKPWGQWLRPHGQVIDLVRRIGDRGSEAWLLNNLGHAYTDLGRPWPALVNFGQALRIRRELGDRVGHAWSRVGMARAFQALGEVTRAAQEMCSAMTEFDALDDRLGWAITISYLGDMCIAMGRPDIAVTYSEQAADTLHDLGDFTAEGCARDTLAEAHRSQGDLTETIAELLRALAVRRHLGDIREQARTLTRLGEVHHARRDHDAAFRAWREALTLYARVGDPAAADLSGLLENEEGGRHALPEPRSDSSVLR